MNYSSLSIILMVSGFYLVLEGLASFFAFSNQDTMFQLGRIARVGIGFFLVYLSTKSLRV